MKRRRRIPTPKPIDPLLVRFPRADKRALREYAEKADDSMDSVVQIAVKRHLHLVAPEDHPRPVLRIVGPEEKPAA